MKEKFLRFFHVARHIIILYLFTWYFLSWLPRLISGDDMDIILACILTPLVIWDLWVFHLVPGWKWLITKLDIPG
jgi:hypothetical protein